MWDRIFGCFKSKKSFTKSKEVTAKETLALEKVGNASKPKPKKVSKVDLDKLNQKDLGLEAFHNLSKLLKNQETLCLSDELVNKIKDNYASFASIVINSDLPNYMKEAYLKSPETSFINSKHPSQRPISINDINAYISLSLKELLNSKQEYICSAKNSILAFGKSILVEELVRLNKSDGAASNLYNSFFGYLEERENSKSMLKSIIDSPEFARGGGGKDIDKLNKAIFTYITRYRCGDHYANRKSSLNDLRDKVYNEFILGDTKLENMECGLFLNAMLFDIVGELLENSADKEKMLNKLDELFKFYREHDMGSEFTMLEVGFLNSSWSKARAS